MFLKTSQLQTRLHHPGQRLLGAIFGLALLLQTVPLPANTPAPAPLSPQTAMRCLQESYPTHICKTDAQKITWCDGTEMVYDDGIVKKTHDDLLNRASLKDHMAMRYPLGRSYPIPLPVNFEPGRVRHQPLFEKMYGSSAKAVGKTLKPVRWMPKSGGKKLYVTSVNGIDQKLKAISDELELLSPALRKIAAQTSGTFVWRKIGGTSRLSMHSFALAIDVAVPQSDYWKWAKKNPKTKALPYKNRIPLEIVEIFEKHGFIWGGKWYHYDTMHFEYRPELLHPLCATAP